MTISIQMTIPKEQRDEWRRQCNAGCGGRYATEMLALLDALDEVERERDATRMGRDKWNSIAIESQHERDALKAKLAEVEAARANWAQETLKLDSALGAAVKRAEEAERELHFFHLLHGVKEEPGVTTKEGQ